MGLYGEPTLLVLGSPVWELWLVLALDELQHIINLLSVKYIKIKEIECAVANLKLPAQC